MVQEKATLLLTKIVCHKASETNGDDVGIQIYLDDSTTVWDYWSCNGIKAGDANAINIEIECEYLNQVRLKLWEKDGNDGDDYIGEIFIQRGNAVDQNLEGKKYVESDDGDNKYTVFWRVIKDPIPTVRVLGIYCEAQSRGMNVDLAENIAGAASTACDAAADVIGKSPRPTRQLISDGFEAASKIIQGVEKFTEWIAGMIEGPDDIYMKQVVQARTEGGGFFPPNDQYHNMTEEDMMLFEDQYGEYFRFPLDTGPVTLELREYDKHTNDIIVGSLIVDPEKISTGSGNGISGGSGTPESEVPPIVGGTAEFDGPAVVEVANAYYGSQNGEGAIYYVCYSVGMEDWTVSARSHHQDAIVYSDMWYSIKNSEDNLFWDAYTDRKVKAYNPYSEVAQLKWQFIPLASGNYKIFSKFHKACLYLISNGEPGENVQIPANGDFSEFKLEDLGNDIIRIKAQNGNPIRLKSTANREFLVVGDGETDNGSWTKWLLKTRGPLKKWYHFAEHCDDDMLMNSQPPDMGSVINTYTDTGKTQQFGIVPTSAGRFKIVNRYYGTYFFTSGDTGKQLELSDSQFSEFIFVELENDEIRIELPNGKPIKISETGKSKQVIVGAPTDVGDFTKWKLRLYKCE